VRRRVGGSEAEAAQAAADLNARLASGASAPPVFTPVSVAELRRRFLDHHEHVLSSSVGTIRRYRAATQHLEDFAGTAGAVHLVDAAAFVAFLRGRLVSPNGHAHTARRRLRDKGVRFILEVCRSLYGFAERKRHLPPYTGNLFAELGLKRLRTGDAKSIFVFDAETEVTFLRESLDDSWAFALHFTLSKTGVRPGELVHLLIEDVDLSTGWLHVRNKPELGWWIKTGCQRQVPLIPEVVAVFKRLIGHRTAGPVFLRRRFSGGVAPLLELNRNGLAQVLRERIADQESQSGQPLSRAAQLRVARTVWRDAGALKADSVRSSFMRIAAAIGHPEATCPKSWRHSFATLLQDANVDPLIRQITLGHKPYASEGALGMTTTYTHTRTSTLRLEIERALRLWPRSLALVTAWMQGESHES
jgi:integrase